MRKHLSVSQSFYRLPPQRASMPIGWLTHSLTVEPLGKINAQSKYATGFNKPEQR